MEQRVKDAGESEGRAVTARIGVQDLPHAKAGRLPAGVSLRDNTANRLRRESRWRGRKHRMKSTFSFRYLMRSPML